MGSNGNRKRDKFFSDAIRLTLVGRIDDEGKEYFMTVPKLPVSVIDLTKVVIFIHPFEEDGEDADGNKKFGAEMLIKPYVGRHQSDKRG